MIGRYLCKGPLLSKDKGYVWFILVMSFLSHFGQIGFTMGVLGNLTIAHKQFFDIDLQTSSLIGSVHLGILFIFSPVSSALVKKLGSRTTELLGGVSMILGVGLSSLSTQLWHAFLLFSILAGVGSSLCLSACTEILAQHFNKYRHLAFSTAPMGSFIGSVVWPIISQYLLNKYGYSKAMGIMASFHVVHIIAGISYFPPNNDVNDETKTCAKTAGDLTHVNEAYVTNDGGGSVERVEQEIDGNTANIPKVRQQNDDIEIRDNQLAEMGLKKDFLALVKSYKVWLLLFHSLLRNTTTATLVVIINDYIVTRTGLNPTNVAFGITIKGIAAIVGSIGVSLTSTLNYDRLILHVTSVLLLSTTTIILAFANTKAVYYVLTAFWGLTEGIMICTLVSVINDCCGTDRQVIFFGMVLFAQGVGGLAGSQLFIYIGTVVGGIYGLLSAGIVGILGNVLTIPLIVSNIRSRQKTNSQK